MAPGPYFLHWLQPLFITFHHHYSTGPFSYFIYFTIELSALFSARPERLTTFPPLGAKYFGWVCAGPRLLKIKSQRFSTFTLLLISRSYWFDKPRFVIQGKLLLATSTPSLGAPPNSSSVTFSPVNYAISHQAVFWRRCRGSWSYSTGSLILSITSLCFCLACFISC